MRYNLSSVTQFLSSSVSRQRTKLGSWYSADLWLRLWKLLRTLAWNVKETVVLQERCVFGSREGEEENQWLQDADY
jgi:hypothetical protein